MASSADQEASRNEYRVHYRVPEFPQEMKTVDAYQQLITNTLIILSDRQGRMEQILENGDLHPQVEEDVRSARGKIMILTENNLKKFHSLIPAVSKDQQGVNDLSGFWSLCYSELKDVERACQLVEKYSNNNWQPLD